MQAKTGEAVLKYAGKLAASGKIDLKGVQYANDKTPRANAVLYVGDGIILNTWAGGDNQPRIEILPLDFANVRSGGWALTEQSRAVYNGREVGLFKVDCVYESGEHLSIDHCLISDRIADAETTKPSAGSSQADLEKMPLKERAEFKFKNDPKIAAEFTSASTYYHYLKAEAEGKAHIVGGAAAKSQEKQA